MTAPRIYVADLAAYNAGYLHGVWIDLTPEDDTDTVGEQVEAMLAAGTVRFGAATCSAKHEEFAIHDYEGFGPVKVDEYDPLDAVLAHVGRMGDDQAAYFAFVDAVGAHEAAEFEWYEARGPFDDPEEYGWQYMDDQIGNDLAGWLERKGMPRDLAACIKFDAEDFLFSARCNGDVQHGTYDGKHYIFERG